ncbi:MAG: Rieske 2Fe-2S domain-containing protein [Nitrososphaerota archaeon]|jgi:nitrite reductase/ring-hydroxylating ferredoxin subunit|nr:Rieske 2Fe-2S domain-containing protein [Nitrososphaerota archaeon]
MEKFQLKGFPAFSVQLSDGTRVAYLDYCPHKGRPITAEGSRVENDTITCPFHNAVFDLRTGTIAKLPVSKTPCPPQCSLIRVVFNEKNEPVGFDGEPAMPKLPERR